MNDQVRVIKHDTIPPHASEWEGEVQHLRRVRDLSRSPELREFIPAGAHFSPSWLDLDADETLSPFFCSVPTLLMICSGSGEVLRGEERWSLTVGQVALLTAGERYRMAVGSSGLRLLKIEFRRTTSNAVLEKGSALERLLSYNESRLADFRKGTLPGLLATGMRQHAERSEYLRHRKVWLLGCQNAFLARQTSCDDPSFSTEFTADLHEELSEQALLSSDQAQTDPALAALMSWFGYQMYTVDDVEKLAITHLVLAQANGVRQICEIASFGGDSVPAEASEHRISARMNRRLERATSFLSVQTEDVQTRLVKTISDAWDTADAAAERLAALTSQGTKNAKTA